eukprot:1240239-Prymnesium_polylepis.1
MDPPRYQPIRSASIPTVPLQPAAATAAAATTATAAAAEAAAAEAAAADGACDTAGGGVGSVRVIAGAFDGVSGPATTVTPIELWEVQLARADVPVELPVPEGDDTPPRQPRGCLLHVCGPRAVAPSLLARHASVPRRRN